jgi:hypothetical protein
MEVFTRFSPQSFIGRNTQRRIYFVVKKWAEMTSQSHFSHMQLLEFLANLDMKISRVIRFTLYDLFLSVEIKLELNFRAESI